MRLNNFLSQTGLCSRREADALIEAGRVKINGQTARLGQRVLEGDRVTLDGKAVTERPPLVTLAYHKPVGITCTTEPEVKGNIIEAVNYPQRIFPIGRLDKDSEGLILLTNDGTLVNRLLRAENGHEKEYRVTLDRDYDQAFLDKMASGVRIYNPVQDEMVITAPCQLKRIDPRRFTIILTQGLNRQIRRMAKACGYEVKGLKRVRILNLKLGTLPKGQWRLLSPQEMDGLNRILDQETGPKED